MWAKLSHFILRNRFSVLVIMVLITIFMGWRAYMAATTGEGWLSYRYMRVLPVDDPMYQAYEAFKARYGEDGNVMVVGFRDSTLFEISKYQDWYDLTDSIRKIDSVENVISIARLYKIVPNDSVEKFEARQVVLRRPQTQQEADSLKEEILKLPFWEGIVINKKENVTLMAITFTQGALNSKNRVIMVKEIHRLAEEFGNKHKIGMHYSGLPWIRSEYMNKISGEAILFLLLSVLITGIILFIFFRYFNAVFFSLIVVIFGLIWSLGTMALFGYKITILTGLIPSLIVIIGIPNCIFLINKYQEELVRHGNKTKALARTVQKVGLSNFLANVTTAIGFGVFYFTNSEVLVQFGIVAAINVMTTYVIAILMTPAIFSYLRVPKPRQMKHLSNRHISRLLDKVDYLVHYRRKSIYLGITLVTLISIVGFKFIIVKGFVVDDLPKNDPIYTDLKFFEKYFGGVVPFEITLEVKKVATPTVIYNAWQAQREIEPGIEFAEMLNHYTTDINTPKNIFDQEGNVLLLMDSAQNIISRREEFSRPISVVEAIKFSYQALKNGNPKAYRMPKNLRDLNTIAGYYKPADTAQKLNQIQQQKLSAFLDTSYTHTRISFQMKDVGSDSARQIVNYIRPRLDSIFPPSQFNLQTTGFSLMFLRSFDYMLHHLFVSLLIAIFSILLLGMALFRSVWIIVLSKLPCLIPLVMTAGIMGFAGIPFKSSTILIFSIAFGIASDGTIYILTEYRQQLRKLSASRVKEAVSRAIHETGMSMIYTNSILFCGFAIFILSGFGGTVALGILLSITLLVSLATNLILLPCILLSLEKRAATKALMEEPLIEIYDEEEDIDADKLTIRGEPRE
ncbi:MAG TPA: MMPL family transporter [Bacteroidia bacterium]|nr:MMPL family transporter [Bacteroidia bacterium]